jgi:hypothetical protein
VVVDGKQLIHTAAGRSLNEELVELREAHKKEVELRGEIGAAHKAGRCIGVRFLQQR